MADGGVDANTKNGNDTIDPEMLYKPPAPKSVKELVATDQEDESLRKYKETLLGRGAAAGDQILVDPSNPNNVIVKSLSLLIEGRPDVVIELSNVKAIENSTFIIKEGCHYQLRLGFYVQREIVAGLKYVQKISKKGLPLPGEKDEYMVGSYAPKKEIQQYTTPMEEAPSGWSHRGTYKVQAKFTDDDKHEWLKWEFLLEIKKDWD